MLRKLPLFLITIFIFNASPVLANQEAFNALRSEYIKALKDHDLAPEVYEKFKQVDAPTAKIYAYKGALEAILTRTTWNFFKKLDYLRKSEKSFEKAVSMAPKSVEVRFMRMAVQYEIPSYLGFSEDLNADKKFILNNIDTFDPAGLDDFTLNQIVAFVKRCDKFSNNQVILFENILALNE